MRLLQTECLIGVAWRRAVKTVTLGKDQHVLTHMFDTWPRLIAGYLDKTCQSFGNEIEGCF